MVFTVVVYNVFHDLARAIGVGRRRRGRKKVEFPEEVLTQYRKKGDVAGKDRFVPTAKQPYMGVAATSKKRKLSAVYSSWTVRETEFVPRVDRIDDYSKLEYFCERNCLACDCCDCCRSQQKPNLANVMNGYLNDLNVASLFIHGHASRTFDSAMSTLEFVRLHRFSMTTMVSIKSIQKHYVTGGISILSTSIWMFGQCIRIILKMAQNRDPNCPITAALLPSEEGFKKPIEQFASICLSMMDSIKVILQYSHNFHNFCKECIRILHVLQVHLGFHTEFNLNKPLRRGDGLQLSRRMSKSAMAKQKSVQILVAKSYSATDDNEEEALEWKNFEDISGNEKIFSLVQLLNITQEGVGLVQTQLRFLLDDIVDSVKDVAEADFLFILADMYDRIRFLGTMRRKHVRPELEQISQLMTDFCKDFQLFVDLGQQIIKRYVEFRDMLHVTYELLLQGLKVDCISEMVPQHMFRRKKGLQCCGACQNKKNLASKYMPKYSPLDFFRVDCKGAFNYEIFANKYYVKLEPDSDPIQQLLPTTTNAKWGEMDAASPRPSFEEYADQYPDSDEDSGLPKKPILIAPPPTTTGTVPQLANNSEKEKEQGERRPTAEQLPKKSKDTGS